ncbi:hypothetical protein [Polaribacter ponticola]|uniref:Uncharacterized protein n=1 Tax=Polaribacter ponticola TaxID=2978475 RepID=A0ABT5SCN6_9FLAO|nr:hypothetical protein [Polaribacter sp. MSW5]MDD7915898.1 hypothetical protein [Polaribacter sp. MSW5]
MSKKLFIFEGQNTEINITKNLSDKFSESFTDIFTSNDVKCAYCTTIYDLYKKISEDEYLDIFMLLKEKEFNKETLKDYNSSDFSEIYLFFDYDGHAPIANDNKLLEVLGLFNEETEHGKIFISYPMVEALKHFSSTIDFKNLKVKAKENINYKKITNLNCDNKYRDFNQYNKTIWLELIEVHLKKLNFIMNNDFSIPKNNVSQKDIFLKQLEKHINIDSSIAVLSAFPLFLFDYYGLQTIKDLIESRDF